MSRWRADVSSFHQFVPASESLTASPCRHLVFNASVSLDLGTNDCGLFERLLDRRRRFSTHGICCCGNRKLISAHVTTTRLIACPFSIPVRFRFSIEAGATSIYGGFSCGLCHLHQACGFTQRAGDSDAVVPGLRHRGDDQGADGCVVDRHRGDAVALLPTLAFRRLRSVAGLKPHWSRRACTGAKPRPCFGSRKRWKRSDN